MRRKRQEQVTEKTNEERVNAAKRYFVVFYWEKEDKYLFYNFDTLKRVLYQKSIYPNAKSTIIKGVEVDNKGHEIIEDRQPIKCKYTASRKSHSKACPYFPAPYLKEEEETQ